VKKCWNECDCAGIIETMLERVSETGLERVSETGLEMSMFYLCNRTCAHKRQTATKSQTGIKSDWKEISE
jgi:hypothetical protein